MAPGKRWRIASKHTGRKKRTAALRRELKAAKKAPEPVQEPESPAPESTTPPETPRAPEASPSAAETQQVPEIRLTPEEKSLFGPGCECKQCRLEDEHDAEARERNRLRYV